MSNGRRLRQLLGDRQIELHPGSLLDSQPPALPPGFDFDRVEGMMLGLAIGDSLGNTSEGLLPAARRRRLAGARGGSVRTRRRKSVMSTAHDWLAYDTEAMVQGDRDYLWHHIKPHKVFQTAEQMIVVSGQGLRVKEKGRLFVRNVCMAFDRYLKAKAAEKPVFSRTV